MIQYLGESIKAQNSIWGNLFISSFQTYSLVYWTSCLWFYLKHLPVWITLRKRPMLQTLASSNCTGWGWAAMHPLPIVPALRVSLLRDCDTMYFVSWYKYKQIIYKEPEADTYMLSLLSKVNFGSWFICD